MKFLCRLFGCLFLSLAASGASRANDSVHLIERTAQNIGNALCQTLRIPSSDFANFGSLETGLNGCKFGWGDLASPFALLEVNQNADVNFQLAMFPETLHAIVSTRRLDPLGKSKSAFAVGVNYFSGRYQWRVNLNCAGDSSVCDVPSFGVLGTF